ncbi:MAG: hypothetical protein R6U54_00175, partial [Candidatus Omnitrophota bacterium]
PITANPNLCQTINELQQEYNNCTQCMDLKDDCPDCCLVDTDSDQNFDAVNCTPEANSEDYSCDSFAFSGDSCSEAECFALDNPDCSNDNPPGCQVKGCPDDDYKPEYDSGEDEACTEESGIWYCTEDNLIPADRGCVPDSETIIDNYDQDFHDDPKTELFYQTNTGGRPPRIEDGDPDFDSDIADSLGESITSYYKYESLTSYSSYISSCISYSNEAESCQKQVKCCQEETCSSEPNPGYGNCTDGCNERLDFDELVKVPGEGIKSCPELQYSDCSLIQERITNCLLGGCASCFRKIDINFSHDFVAKSGESLTIFWNILSKPDVTPAAGYTEVQARDAIDTYFYTIVKVIDASGDPVYSSIMHQKSFNNAFSIFNATHLDSTYLKTGEEYSVGIYYYLPDITEDIAEVESMKMDIAGMEMTLIKIRE